MTNMYPEARSVGLWLRHGWYVAIAYVVGFIVMLAVIGWHPDQRSDGKGLVNREPHFAAKAGVD